MRRLEIGAALVLTTLVATSLRGQPPSSSNPGPARQAQIRQRVQARVEQRARTQIQQRAQAQIRQRIQNRTQTRVQADAERAARIAQHAARIAQRRAAAGRNRAADAVAKGRVANPGVRARVRGANANSNSAAKRSKAPLGIREGRVRPRPPRITDSDFITLDKIFGDFNPLRGGPLTKPPRKRNPPPTASGRPDFQDDFARSKDKLGRKKGKEERIQRDVWRPNLADRFRIAAASRRAQISEIRDRALATDNVKLLRRAQQMEDALNAFVAARKRLRERDKARIADGATQAEKATVR